MEGVLRAVAKKSEGRVSTRSVRSPPFDGRNLFVSKMGPPGQIGGAFEGVSVPTNQTPCKSGCPSGVRGGIHVPRELP